MGTRHDQHAVVGPQPLRQRGRRPRSRIAYQGDAPGLGGDVAHRRAAGRPRGHDGLVPAQDAPGAFDQPFAAPGLERQPRQPVVDRAGRDRRVVATPPQIVDHVRRSRQPPDAQPRQAVRLREPPGHHHPFVSAPRRRRAAAVELGAAVYLVDEQPAPPLRRDLAQPGNGRFVQARAGRVVRVAHGDEPRAGADRAAYRVEVETPPGRSGLEPHFAHRRPERPDQPRDLHVGGMDDDGFVARLDQPPAGEQVRLGAAVGDEDVGGRRPAVERRDPLAQRRGAVGLGVLQGLREQRVEIGAGRQFPDLQGVGPALGQVDPGVVLVDRLPAFEVEGVDAHSLAGVGPRRRRRAGGRPAPPPSV